MNEHSTSILALALKAAQKAGQIIMELRDRPVIDSTQSHNLVTDADLAAQEVIIDTIKEKYPGHLFMAEEGDVVAKESADHLWVIDPLDGTNNYAHGIPQFCTSIAYARKGLVEVGVVFDPTRLEMYSAVRGQGAFLNGEKISVYCNKTLPQAMIVTGFYYDRGALMRKTLSSMEKLFTLNVRGIRRFGSAALDLCWVACGRFDAYFEYQLSAWDFAAGMLLVQEAGGRCTDAQNSPLKLDNKLGILASNDLLHDSLSAVVAL